VRLETARRLILQTDLPLPDVAARCGFSSQSILGRAFKAAYGEAPGRFRRSRRRH
jgi:transcriptional regulator GlxA family with amidase domain